MARTSDDLSLRRPAAPSGLPRLLSATGEWRREHLAEHLEHLGPVPRPAGRRRERDGLIAEVERSGLRGRGGSSFPTAVKMRAVAGARGAHVVLANGSEGEPASAKDEFLLTTRPHLVLDGAVLAAEAVGASEIVVAVGRRSPSAIRSVTRAVEERMTHGVDGPSIRVVEPPNRYVAGEESALVRWVNGGEAKPTSVPPRPYERGVLKRPTLVQNVETLANIALIARFGADWFRSVGTDAEPGTVLVTLGGAVARPGVFEVELGTTVAELVRAGGGPSEEIRAFLFGGYFGSWVTAAAGWDLPLAAEPLRRVGAALGAGVVFALPDASCGIVESARVAQYLAGESAGQCGPCVNGLAAIADALTAVAAGRKVAPAVGQLRRWTKQVAGRGACHLPDGATHFVATALDVFAEEVDYHRARGSCSRPRARPLLPLPLGDRREGGWR